MDIDNKKNPFAALSYPQDGHFGNLFGGFLLLFRTRTQKTTTGLVVLAIETGACNHQLINLRCTGARYNSSLRVEAGAGKKSGFYWQSTEALCMKASVPSPLSHAAALLLLL